MYSIYHYLCNIIICSNFLLLEKTLPQAPVWVSQELEPISGRARGICQSLLTPQLRGKDPRSKVVGPWGPSNGRATQKSRASKLGTVRFCSPNPGLRVPFQSQFSQWTYSTCPLVLTMSSSSFLSLIHSNSQATSCDVILNSSHAFTHCIFCHQVGPHLLSKSPLHLFPPLAISILCESTLMKAPLPQYYKIFLGEFLFKSPHLLTYCSSFHFQRSHTEYPLSSPCSLAPIWPANLV